MQDYTHLTAFRQATSESLVFMILAVKTVEAEEVDVSMPEVVVEYMEEKVNKVEDDTAEEVM